MRRAPNFAAVGLLALMAGSHAGRAEPPPLESSEIVTMLEKTGEAGDYPGAHTLTVHHHTDVTVEQSGLSHVVERKVVKVLDTDGVRETSVLRFNYDPASQYQQIRWVKVFKKDGTVLERNVDKARDLPQPARSIRWGARMKILDVPGLSPGDSVAWETYSKGFQIAYLAEGDDEEKYIPPMKGHFYDVVLFEDTVPIIERRYSLHLPRSKPVHAKVYNGEVMSEVRADDDQLHYVWSKHDVAARPDEKRQPGRTDFVTKVVLATVHEWSDKSVWFFEVNDPVFEANPAIEAKVKQIIAGKKSDLDKVEALQRWVAHNIRYSGISMGKGEGYTIHPGIMTFEDRCGVCKDIAGMLITMMRAAGYTVYPAMTMAGAKVEKVAADQFNHCVVAWKQDDGSFVMLDPTWAPFSTKMWSYAEGEQNYVVGSPEGEDLTATEKFTAQQNRFVLEGKSRIGKDGSLSGSLELSGTGYPDTRLRRTLAYTQSGEGEALMHKLLSSISPYLDVTSYKATDHADLDRPFVQDFRYRASHYATASDRRVSFVVPLAHFILDVQRWSPYYLLGDWKERKNPAMFWFPQEVLVHEVVSLPGGLVPASLPDPLTYEGEWTSYDFEMSRKGSNLVYDARWTVKSRMAPPESFEDLDRLSKALDKVGQTEVILVDPEEVKP